MSKRAMPVFYDNETKFKPKATVKKIEIKIFNWVTLSTILYVSNVWTSSNLLHLVHLAYKKWCSFANVINE